MKVCFETFGCRLNRAEALEMEAAFTARGWRLTERHDDADMIVVRGCSVTQRAQRDCERLVEHVRSKYPLKRLVVTGCLKERRNEHWLRDLAASAGSAVPSRTARAYLKVQDGCGSACSFCIVPQFRGRSASVPVAEAVEKARRFAGAGYREIVVTGCNLAQYSSGGAGLAVLVGALADSVPECRFRLGSLEPAPAARDAIAAMADRENVCRYVHMPVQSGSDRVLAAMRRPYRRRDVEQLVAEAERLMPHLGLGCDIMTGFPDEKETDFTATQAMLARLPFTKIHVFPFSERPGTVAASLPNPVPHEIRRERAHAVAEAAEKARVRYIARFKGHRVRVVVEDPDTLGGWTSEYVWCQTDEKRAKFFGRPEEAGGRGVGRRDFVEMNVREARGHVLLGDPV